MNPDQIAVAAASNPWVCSAVASTLPAARVDRPGILRRLARLLHDWPGDTPTRLHAMDERLCRVFAAIAGHPEIAPGSLPFDQPFRPEAAAALELTLALDAWPPLAGRHSLRAELLWLDRMSRHAAETSALPARPDTAMWLRIVLAWLLAGLALSDGAKPDHAVILMDVLYDPEERSDAAGPIRGAAELLLNARARLAARAAMRRGFARAQDGNSDGAACEWLWWRRLGGPLSIQDGGVEQAPEPGPAADECSLEVRFHGIQAWMMQTPGDGRPADAGDSRADRLYGSMMRGASDVLEAVVSVVRTVVLRRLGPGSILVNGGGRVSARSPADNKTRAEIEDEIWAALDRMFCPEGLLGRRFAGVLAVLERQQFLRPLGPGPAEARAERQRLAWSAIPPISVTFAEHPSEVEREATDPLRIPIRRSWPGAPSASHSPNEGHRNHRASIAMSLPARLRTEIGVQAPRDRLLRLRLHPGGEAGAVRQLPSAFQPFRQLLVADLNGLGALFSRTREPHPDLEAMARRSLRFFVHWLLALNRVVAELDQETLPEVLVLGGDDLIVGTRHETGDLLEFARCLSLHLRMLNDELPPCDGVSFSAGLVTLRPAHYTSRTFLLDAVRLERRAKARWHAEAGGRASGGSPARADTVTWWGEGMRRCVVLTAPAGVDPLPIADPADPPPPRTVLGRGAVPHGGAPFSRLVAGARSSVPDLDRAGHGARVEVVVEEGDSSREATLRVEAVPARQKRPDEHAPRLCEPCVARRG